MRLYKLTNILGQTHGNTQWGESVSHTAIGRLGQPLCSDGWIHAYESPEIAVLMNPNHGNFHNPRLWEAEGEIGLRDGPLKCGCRTLTTIREIPLPAFTKKQLIRFAIHCAAQVCSDTFWRLWAAKWLNGTDRSSKAASAARPPGDAAANNAAMAVVGSTVVKAAAVYVAAAAEAACTVAEINLLAAIAFAKGSSNELPECRR